MKCCCTYVASTQVSDYNLVWSVQFYIWNVITMGRDRDEKWSQRSKACIFVWRTIDCLPPVDMYLQRLLFTKMDVQLMRSSIYYIYEEFQSLLVHILEEATTSQIRTCFGNQEIKMWTRRPTRCMYWSCAGLALQGEAVLPRAWSVFSPSTLILRYWR